MMGESGLHLGGASRPDSCLQPWQAIFEELTKKAVDLAWENENLIRDEGDIGMKPEGDDVVEGHGEAEVGSDSDRELQEVDQEHIESEGERDQSSQEIDLGDQRDERDDSEGKDSVSDQIGQRVVTSRRRKVVESDSERSEENQYLQWRFANARVDATMKVQRATAQDDVKFEIFCSKILNVSAQKFLADSFQADKATTREDVDGVSKKYAILPQKTTIMQQLQHLLSKPTPNSHFPTTHPATTAAVGHQLPLNNRHHLQVICQTETGFS
ncbi:protein LEO1 homolog isoform X2 [Tanacetum coccineum]